MRKLMTMAVMSVAMLAAASPAFADTTVQILDASQFQSAVAVQGGDANAAAADGSVAVAGTGLYVFQGQYNGGF